MKKPRRWFRSRREPETAPDAPWWPLAPEISARMAGPGLSPGEVEEGLDLMRRVRQVVDPSRNYRETMPDGRIFEIKGADLIAIADAIVAVQDAVDRGEPAEVVEALIDRLDATL
jgi:hypothetical protein